MHTKTENRFFRKSHSCPRWPIMRKNYSYSAFLHFPLALRPKRTSLTSSILSNSPFRPTAWLHGAEKGNPSQDQGIRVPATWLSGFLRVKAKRQPWRLRSPLNLFIQHVYAEYVSGTWQGPAHTEVRKQVWFLLSPPRSSGRGKLLLAFSFDRNFFTWGIRIK